MARIVPKPSEVPSGMTKASRPDRQALEVRQLQAPRPKALSTVISTISTSQEQSMEYPDLPRAKEGELRVQCPYCFAPLEHKGSEKNKTQAWRRHIDEHVKPYACLFPQCAKALTFFTRRREWQAHMETNHPKDWLRKVHTIVWYCDIDHDEPLTFDTENAWRSHMKDLTLHPKRQLKVPTQTQLDALSPRKQQAAPRDPYVCPLCEQVPPKVRPLIEKSASDPVELEAQVGSHVADHLKTLALMALPSLHNGQSHPDQSAESVEMMGEEDLKRQLNEGSVAVPPSGIELIGNEPLTLEAWGDETVDELWQAADLVGDSWDHEYHDLIEMEHLPEPEQNLWTGPWLLSAENSYSQHAWDEDPIVATLMQRTPLHQAVATNDIQLIQNLLRLDVDIRARDVQGFSALNTASARGNLQAMELLLEAGEDITASLLNTRESHTSIGLACEQGHTDAVELLLRKGADLKYRGTRESKAEVWSCLSQAAYNGHADVVRLLLNGGADIDWGWAPRPPGLQDNVPPLIAAVRGDHIDIVRLLLYKGASVNLEDGYNKLALHWAAQEAANDSMKLLISRGANVRALDGNQYCALTLALRSKAYEERINEAVYMLIERGADLHALDSSARTPLHWAAATRSVVAVKNLLANGANVHLQDGHEMSPLLCAVQTLCKHPVPSDDQEELDERAHEVISLLISAGASPNVPGLQGAAPLLQSVRAATRAIGHPCFEHRMSVVHLLIHSGAYLEQIDHEGATAVSVATADPGLLRTLLDAGAQVETSDAETYLPLVEAALYQRHASIALLLERGANVNAFELRRSATALMMAAHRGLVDTVDLLLEHGADSNRQDQAGNTALSTALRLSESCPEIFGQETSNYLPSTAAVAKRLILAGAFVNRRERFRSPANLADDDANARKTSLITETCGDCSKMSCVGRLGRGGGCWPMDPEPLYGAARRGDTDLVQTLLDAGADIDVWSETLEGYTVTEIMGAAMSRSEETVEVLLRAGAHVNAQILPGYGTTALMQAVSGSVALVKLLLEAGANPNALGSGRNTALRIACELERDDVVQALLAAGANVDESRNDGTTPLMAATRLGDLKMVVLLLRAGADPRLADERGRTVNDLLQPESDMALSYGLPDGNMMLRFAIRTWGSSAHIPDSGARVQGHLWTSIELGWASGIGLALEDGADIHAVDDTGHGALHLALQKTPYADQVAIIRELVDRGASLEARDTSGRTPLEFAIHLVTISGTPHPLRALVTAGIDPSPLFSIPSSLTTAPLLTTVQMAALTGNSQAIDLYERLDPNATTETAAFGSLWLAVKFEDLEMVKKLLVAGARVKNERDPFISLHAVAHYSVRGLGDERRYEILRQLLSAGADPNGITETDSGPAPLVQLFAQEGDAKAVQLLLEEGAEPDTRALVAAARTGNLEIAQLLIDRGADIHGVDDEGWTPLHHSVVCRDVRAPKVVNLLLVNGAVVDVTGRPPATENSKFRGNTALYIASSYGRWQTIEVLIAAGADPNSRGWGDRTPLHACANSNQVEGAQLLLDAGAHLNATDVDGRTPVCEAAIADQAQMVRYLLGKGADVPEDDLYTILSWAAEGNHVDVVAFLRLAGLTESLSSSAWLKIQNYLEAKGSEHIWRMIHDGEVKDSEVILMIQDPNLLSRVEYVRVHKTNPLLALSEPGDAGSAWHKELLNAVQHFNIQVIQKRLETRIDVNTADSNGNSVLTHTARYNRPELVPLLVEAGATFDALVGDALNIASQFESPEMAEVLLQASGDSRFNSSEIMDKRNALLEGLLGEGVWESWWSWEKKVKRVKILIEAGASMTTLVTHLTLFMHPDQDEAMSRVLDAGLDVNSPQIVPSALDASARAENPELVRFFLGAGATRTNGEVLEWSAIKGHAELAYFMSLCGMVPVGSRTRLCELADINGNRAVVHAFGFPDMPTGLKIHDRRLIDQLTIRGHLPAETQDDGDPNNDQATSSSTSESKPGFRNAGRQFATERDLESVLRASMREEEDDKGDERETRAQQEKYRGDKETAIPQVEESRDSLDVFDPSIYEEEEERLFEAIRAGTLGTVREWTSQVLGAHEESPTSETGVHYETVLREHALFLAVQYDRVEMIPLLVESGVSIEEVVGKPLMLAMREGKTEMVKALLDARPRGDYLGTLKTVTEIDTCLPIPFPGAQLLDLQWAFLEAALLGELDIAAMLVKAGARCSASRSQESESQESESWGGVVALQLVAQGSVQSMRMLLEAELDPNVESRGLSALDRAAIAGEVEIVRLLLGAGATNTSGSMLAVLLLAAKKGYPDIMRFLDLAASLDEYQAGVAMDIAQRNGQNDVVRILLRKGPATLLDYALISHPGMRAQLGKHGIWEGLDV